MPAHKRKPNYNGATTMQELLDAVCDYYGDPVDDRKEEDAEHVSLHDVADEFDITVMKARKLLITGGLYSTSLSRKVQEFHAQGLTVAQITEETGLKRASINSYLPYAHIIYNLPDISIKAERQKQYRVRKRNSVRTDVEREEKLWQELIYLQGSRGSPWPFVRSRSGCVRSPVSGRAPLPHRHPTLYGRCTVLP